MGATSKLTKLLTLLEGVAILKQAFAFSGHDAVSCDSLSPIGSAASPISPKLPRAMPTPIIRRPSVCLLNNALIPETPQQKCNAHMLAISFTPTRTQGLLQIQTIATPWQRLPTRSQMWRCSSQSSSRQYCDRWVPCLQNVVWQRSDATGHKLRRLPANQRSRWSRFTVCCIADDGLRESMPERRLGPSHTVFHTSLCKKFAGLLVYQTRSQERRRRAS